MTQQYSADFHIFQEWNRVFGLISWLRLRNSTGLKQVQISVFARNGRYGAATMRSAHARIAYSINELLIVIGIILVLMSLTIVGSYSLETGSKRAKTMTILSAVRKGLELTVATKGGLISPAEHPLAGSRSGRFQFSGVRGRKLQTNGSVTGGELRTDLDMNGEALAGTEEWYYSSDSDRNRVLMPDDWFADWRVPGLYGMQRNQLGVVGAPLQAATRYRNVNRPPLGSEPIVLSVYLSNNPQSSVVIAPEGQLGDDQRAFQYLFGSSSVQSELLAMQALSSPPNDLPRYRIKPPTDLNGSDNAGRVWSEVGQDPCDGRASWAPGLIQDGYMDDPDYAPGITDWKPYRLRGLAIYDAWGREVLYNITTGGALCLTSAGRDGVFKWLPGSNMIFDTPANGSVAIGDDRDGASDNVALDVAQ
jgi:hypothetical protein